MNGSYQATTILHLWETGEIMAFINFLKPKISWKKADAPPLLFSRMKENPRKSVRTVIKIYRSAVFGQISWYVPADIIFE